MRLVRLPDPTPGVREYRVDAEAGTLGVVANRPGGWWRAFSADGTTYGSFHPTRKSAVAALPALETP